MNGHSRGEVRGSRVTHACEMVLTARLPSPLCDDLEAEMQVGCEKNILLPVDAVQFIPVQFGV